MLEDDPIKLKANLVVDKIYLFRKAMKSYLISTFLILALALCVSADTITTMRPEKAQLSLSS